MPLAVAMWHAWPARGWPASHAEEMQLVAALRASADHGQSTPRRSDYTAIVTALRSGATLDEIHSTAPGIHPERLLAAYEDLERRRRVSVEAWHGLSRPFATGGAIRLATIAARLMPVPARRVLLAAALVRDTASLAAVIRTLARRVHLRTEITSAIEVSEGRGGRLKPPGKTSALLANPDSPGLWADPYYLPGRVGALSPQRVATLLGEIG